MRRETFTILTVMFITLALGMGVCDSFNCDGCADMSACDAGKCYWSGAACQQCSSVTVEGDCTASNGCEWTAGTPGMCSPVTGGGGGGDACVADLGGTCCTVDTPTCPGGNSQFGTGCGQKPGGGDYDCCNEACVDVVAPVACTGGDPVGYCCTEGNTVCGGSVFDTRTGCGDDYQCCDEACGADAVPADFLYPACENPTENCCDTGKGEDPTNTADCYCSRFDDYASECNSLTQCTHGGTKCGCDASGFVECPAPGPCKVKGSGMCCEGDSTWREGAECCIDGDCEVTEGCTAEFKCVKKCVTAADCDNFMCVGDSCDTETCTCSPTDCADGYENPPCGGTCHEIDGDPLLGECCDNVWQAAWECCVSDDCSENVAKKTCDSVSHLCTDDAGCSDTKPCTGNFACVSDACSTDTCVTGYTLCGSTCNQDPGECCDTTWHAGSGKCCIDDDCGEEECVDNTCTAPPECSDTDLCTGNFACVSDACSTDTCVTDYTFCGTTCNADPGECCDSTWHAGSDKCCVKADCTGDQVCTANTCAAPAACSDTNLCTGNFACVSDVCSTDACVTDYTLCGTTCNQDPGKCCATTWHAGSDKCCIKDDCTGDLVCTSNTCTTPPACSDTNLCTGNFACVSDVCSTDACVTGYTLCGTTCNKNPGECCDTTWHAGSDKCCTDGDCTGTGETCSANACVAGGGTGTPAGCTGPACDGLFACIEGTCSTTQCIAGYNLCAGECKVGATGKCCAGVWTEGAVCCSNDDCTDPAKSCQANKCEDLVCTSCQMTSNHTCVARTDGGKCCTDAWIAGAACCIDGDCTVAGETCQTNNQCSSLACDVGQVPCGTTCYTEADGKCCQGTWYAGGKCCDDSGCDSDKSCDTSKTCVALACTTCQEVSNHQCVERTGGKCCTGAWFAGGDCCENANCIGGQYCDTNAHLCRDFSTMPPGGPTPVVSGGPTPVTTLGPTTSAQPQPSSTPVATPAKPPPTVCGDLQCSEGETSKSCCTDCGCDPGYRCRQNQCVKEIDDIKAVCGDDSCDSGENYNTCCVDCGCTGKKECKDGVCVDSQVDVQKVMDTIKLDDFADAGLIELRNDGWKIGKPELQQTADGEYDVVITARKGNERIAITAVVDTKTKTLVSWHVPETKSEGPISVQTLLIGAVIAIIGIGAMYVMQSRPQVVVVQAPPEQAAPPSGDYGSGGGEDEDLPDWFQ